jgi:hypothetical protein
MSPPESSDPVLTSLPERIRERVTPIPPPGDPDDGKGGAGGEFVLYWMRTAVRGHENPALDAALEAARALDLPVLVYHALSERYPYASDRHHTFILQGAREAAAELRERGVAYAFHLERPGHRGPHLKTLAGRARRVVTEDMPVPPLDRWTRSVAGAAGRPVWAVDAACTHPMRLVPKKAASRAYRFRDATKEARRERIQAGWDDTEAAPSSELPELPFEPVDLDGASIPELVAACEIDHGVAPVPHTTGGSAAGYARWAAFLDDGISGYKWKRNDPLVDGTSRMSPFLHYGHVSPFRIAQEAHEPRGKGPGKYLDELLVWRELAWAFCWHHDALESLEVLPDWAAETLRERDEEPRDVLSWERLARARTGDRLWDAAQRHLLIHGELHNNVRMTWGKALVGWSPDAETALRRTVDLNHRYALDGRDPSSYGGILWCYGALDRPFDPPRGLLGKVRSRTTDSHADRLDVAAYEDHTGRPLVDPAPRVAVVGAGVAGLACARTLVDHGLEVVVVDKGRTPGGRCSTRRSRDDSGLHFDHGAQYFTARDKDFQRHVAAWEAEGVVARWDGRFARIEGNEVAAIEPSDVRWVGTPAMESLPHHLAEDVEVRSGVRVEGLERRDDRWILRGVPSGGEDGSPEELGPFDAVVVTAPPAQAAPLVAEGAPELAEQAREAHLAPCWAVMIRARRGPGWDAAEVEGGPLAWIARNGSKPGRDDASTWVLHAGPEWSAHHLEASDDEVIETLVDAFRQLPGAEGLEEPDHARAHRWRYARARDPRGPRCRVSTDGTLILAGDGCVAPRVEGAWLSGVAAAGRILGRAVEEMASRVDDPRAGAPGRVPSAPGAMASGPVQGSFL